MEIIEGEKNAGKLIRESDISMIITIMVSLGVILHLLVITQPANNHKLIII